jgi:hypothetical protein
VTLGVWRLLGNGGAAQHELESAWQSVGLLVYDRGCHRLVHMMLSMLYNVNIKPGGTIGVSSYEAES